MPKTASTDAKATPTKFVFVASHGLQTPLSAIRWGIQRLKKMEAANLSRKQKHLIDHIEMNSRTLSRVLNSMLLLARNEDDAYVLKASEIDITKFLKDLARESKADEGLILKVSCPAHVTLVTDPLIFATIFQNLLSVFAASPSAKTSVKLTVEKGKRTVTMFFETELEFPVLNTAAPADTDHNQLVGGTSGLMLSLANSLAHFLDGYLMMTMVKDSKYRLELTFPIVD